MNASSLLHEEIAHACPHIHKVRLITLMDATDALCHHQQASLTGLGRTLHSKVKTKHCIKRVDRLLGNTKLHQERADIYQAMTSRLIATGKKPLVLIDWSQINEESGFHIIRASIPMGGRSLTIYEEVHPKKKSNSPKTQRLFLSALKGVLADDITPIIVSDAGFKNPWFKAVSALGWYWVGRVRNRVAYRYDGDKVWHLCSQLHAQASATPQIIGAITLTKTNPILCYAHLYQKLPQGRKKRTQGKRVSKRTLSTDCGRREREPWLLVTNMPLDRLSSSEIVAIYATRMQIEESFRDSKNQRIGLSLKETKSRDEERLQVLLLIVALASLLLWLIGQAATEKMQHRDYQANTEYKKTVISLFNLGLQILRKDAKSIMGADLIRILRHLEDYTMKILKT